VQAISANVDDLGDWRPGLRAAAEHGVRHPLVEAGFGKSDIRRVARELQIPSAEKPAMPCLASRLPFGTAVDRAVLAVFAGFDPRVVAAFGPDDRARLLGDAGIVRNRAKIDATIANGARFLETGREFGSFAAYLESVVPPPPRRQPPSATSADIPATTAASDALSRDLRGRGFGFVGSTIVYAFMQSVGLVDDHLPGCFRYRA